MEEIRVKFEGISGRKREKLENEFYQDVIKMYRKEEIKGSVYRYEVILQDTKYTTILTDEEVRASCKLAIDLLEEMKQINNNGVNKKKFNKLCREIYNIEKEDRFAPFFIVAKLKTERMSEIILEIDRIQRVGGAYAMVIAHPLLYSAIFGVYEQIVDRFDDVNFYEVCGFFLVRAILKIHSRLE